MMGLEGVAASTVTYNCVIDACAHGGNPGKAAEIFAEMKERKVRGKEQACSQNNRIAGRRAGLIDGGLILIEWDMESIRGRVCRRVGLGSRASSFG